MTESFKKQLNQYVSLMVEELPIYLPEGRHPQAGALAQTYGLPRQIPGDQPHTGQQEHHHRRDKVVAAGGLHLHHVPRPGTDGVAGQGQDLLLGPLGTAGAGPVAVQSALHLPEERDLRHAVSDDLLHNRVLNHALCLQRAQRSTLTTTVYSPITPTALLASR